MNDLTDIVGGANLTTTKTFDPTDSFNVDRNQYLNRAKHLTRDYFTFPTRYYFEDEFSITAWISVHEDYPSNIIEFSDSCTTNSLSLGITWGSALIATNDEDEISTPNKSLSYNWQHVALVISDGDGYLYINGQLITQERFKKQPKWGKNNYIGKSSCGYQNIHSVLDDIKVFSDALTSEEVYNDYAQIIPRCGLNNSKINRKIINNLKSNLSI